MTILPRDEISGPGGGELPFDPRHPELEIMLRGLLHELRNPLSSIITAATLLQDSMQPETMLTGEENRMLLDVVKKESLRLNHILTCFADYIKLPAPQPAVFDLSDTIREIVQELERQKVLGQEIKVDDRLLATTLVRADQAQVRQALQHLIVNAVEAMPGGGCLFLAASSAQNQDEVVVCIGDSGSGFLGESRSRAFQLFFSTKAHHLGLGLPVAKSIIELNGGQIWLDEARSKTSLQSDNPQQIGTSVCLTLPRAS